MHPKIPQSPPATEPASWTVSVDTNGLSRGCVTGIVWRSADGEERHIRIESNVGVRAEGWGALKLLEQLPEGVHAKIYVDTLEAARVLQGESSHRYERQGAALIEQKKLQLDVTWVPRSHPWVQAADQTARRRDIPAIQHHDPRAQALRTPYGHKPRHHQGWMRLKSGQIELRVSTTDRTYRSWSRPVADHGAMTPAMVIADAALELKGANLLIFSHIGSGLWSQQQNETTFERQKVELGRLESEAAHVERAHTALKERGFTVEISRVRRKAATVPAGGALINLRQIGPNVELNVQLCPSTGQTEFNRDLRCDISEISERINIDPQTFGGFPGEQLTLGEILRSELERLHRALPPTRPIIVFAGGGTLELLDDMGGRTWNERRAINPDITQRVQLVMPARKSSRRLRQAPGDHPLKSQLSTRLQQLSEVLSNMNEHERAKALAQSQLSNTLMAIVKGVINSETAAQNLLSNSVKGRAREVRALSEHRPGHEERPELAGWIKEALAC